MMRSLFDGIQHYIANNPFYNDPYELIFMFLMGERPKPSCVYQEYDESGQATCCGEIAEFDDIPLCRDHRCQHGQCENEVAKPGTKYCISHVCRSDGCDQHVCMHDSNAAKELFCHDHACFQCILLGKTPALEALDEPPRNTCENHLLCSVLDCQDLAVMDEDYCSAHKSTKCKADGCSEWAIARGLPFCRYHEREMEKLKNASNARTTTQAGIKSNDSRVSLRQCMSNNKKGKPCKSPPMPGCDFCEAHAPKDGTGFKAQQKQQEESTKSIEAETNIDSEKEIVFNTELLPDNKASETHENIGDEEYGLPPDLDNLDLTRYDADEVNEGDGTQHIREIFDVESGDDDSSETSSDEDEFKECIEEDEAHVYECQSVDVERFQDPKDWSWTLSLNERWAACQAFLYHQCDMLLRVQDLVKRELPLARKRMHDAESRAKARVFENKTVIGGTIVGCIARLEEIRATRPFVVSTLFFLPHTSCLFHEVICPQSGNLPLRSLLKKHQK
jgi:hypothetical protein